MSMALKARDLMQSEVVTIGPETPLASVYRVLVAEGITGAPVVDDSGRVLGVISSADLLRAATDEQDSGSSDTVYFEGLLEFSNSAGAGLPDDFQNRLQQIPASEAMTDGAISVGLDTPLAEIAHTMRIHRIHRVLVVEDTVLEGILTSFDLVALLEKGAP
jgi:CBS domain-containing protein